MLRSIAARLLLCAAVMVAMPAGVSAGGGADTDQMRAADQVALGAAKPADGRLVSSSARRPEPVARLAVVLGLLPGAAVALARPAWSAYAFTRPAPIAAGRPLVSCKTSRGPPRHGSPTAAS